MTVAGRRQLLGEALAACLVVAVTAGCGIPAENSAHRNAPGDIPFGLTEAETATTSTTSAAGPQVQVYQLRNGRLAAVARSEPTGGDLEGLASLLAGGPTAEERRLGVSTALPENRPVRAVTVSRGVATVDLGASFADVAADDQVLAIAQIVFTVTERPGIGRVRFTLDGKSIDVPTGDGSLTIDALARDDFADQAPRPGS